jgi:hypothetical protein
VSQKFRRFRKFRELRPEFPGTDANSKNYKLKTKQKGITPMNTQMKTLMKQRLYASTQLVLALVALAVGASTANGAPGDLFESDLNSGTINKFAPDGTRSTFATELNWPNGLAFDSAGNLYGGDQYSGTIYKFAPDGTRSTFATGLNNPTALACDSGGNLFEADWLSGTIYKFAPDGTRSTFATGVGPYGLAFDSAGKPLRDRLLRRYDQQICSRWHAEHFRCRTKWSDFPRDSAGTYNQLCRTDSAAN